MENIQSKFKMSYVFIGVGLILVLWVWSSYNSLVKGNIAADGAWAQVENQYQRRLELIPNLVASVQGIMTQEKDVFLGLAEKRTRYAGATTVNEKARAAGELESSLSRLLVVMENYPQLSSSQNMRDLQAELSGTENRVAVERMRFNEAVIAYNTRIITFPGNIIAKIFSFTPRELFKAAPEASKAPPVQFK